MKIILSEILKDTKEHYKEQLPYILTVYIPNDLINNIINTVIKPILNNLLNTQPFTIDTSILNKIVKKKICQIWDETSKIFNYIYPITIYNYVIILELSYVSIKKMINNNMLSGKILYIIYEMNAASDKIKKLTNIERINFIC